MAQTNCTAVVNSNGTYSVTITDLSLAWSFDYDLLCDGTVADTAAVSGGPITADAVNDFEGTHVTATFADDVSGNDTACSEGASTYLFKAGTAVNGTVVVNTNGTYTFTPTVPGAWSFQYDIQCTVNGVSQILDTATVDGLYVTAGAVNDIIADVITTAAIPGDVTTNDTVCTAPSTTTYALTAASEVNGTATVNANGTFSFTPAASGVWSFNYDILCDGIVADTAVVSGRVLSASAVEDSFATATGDASTNDTGCNLGAEVYSKVGASETNVVATVNSNGTYSSVITDLSLTWSFDYAISCDGTQVDTATVSGGPVTATAVDDAEGSHVTATFADNASTNDTACSEGTSTYILTAASEVNGSVALATNGTYTFTPTVGGAWSFGYDLRCTVNGVTQTIDTGTVSGTYVSANAVDDTGSAATGDASTNDTSCSSGATTYQLTP